MRPESMHAPHGPPIQAKREKKQNEKRNQLIRVDRGRIRFAGGQRNLRCDWGGLCRRKPSNLSRLTKRSGLRGRGGEGRGGGWTRSMQMDVKPLLATNRVNSLSLLPQDP